MLAREAHRLLIERANEAREQGDMFMCEVEQRVVDDFWGIDKHNWLLQRDEERRKHIFISKTEDMRRMMVHVGAIQVTSPPSLLPYPLLYHPLFYLFSSTTLLFFFYLSFYQSPLPSYSYLSPLTFLPTPPLFIFIPTPPALHRGAASAHGPAAQSHHRRLPRPLPPPQNRRQTAVLVYCLA